jgi:seryl-tRNA synthetase
VRFEVDSLNKEVNAIQKEIGMRMKNKESADELIAKKNQVSEQRDQVKKLADEKEQERDRQLGLIGNLVHDSVPVSKDEVRGCVDHGWMDGCYI